MHEMAQVDPTWHSLARVQQGPTQGEELPRIARGEIGSGSRLRKAQGVRVALTFVFEYDARPEEFFRRVGRESFAQFGPQDGQVEQVRAQSAVIRPFAGPNLRREVFSFSGFSLA